MDGLLFAGVTSRKELLNAIDGAGFEVDSLSTLEEMRTYIIEERPRMVVLVGTDKSWLKTVRQLDKIVPVLVIGTAEADDQAEIAALKAGADVFLRHSASGDVLVAWVEALYKRLERCPFGQEHYAFGDVEVDVFRRTVKKRGWRILMSATEFDLLVHLIRNNGRVVSRDEILREVWKYDTCPTTRTVDNFICKLRRKIEGTDGKANHLKTVKGTGYRFDLDVSTPG